MDRALQMISSLDQLLARFAEDQRAQYERYTAKEKTLSVEEKRQYDEEAGRLRDDFTTNWNAILHEIDELCIATRDSQPLLRELNITAMNQSGKMPDEIALGRYHVQYEAGNGQKLELYVPRLFSFPLKKPMYIVNREHYELFQKILVRLMFALPMDRQEYYVYDPIHLGETMLNFNILLKNENLFPQKKVMTNQIELKAALKEVKEYINSLYESAFKPALDIVNWESYNRYMETYGDIKKMLPYKVFILMDIPTGMDQECFDMIKVIMGQSSKCGCLILFSFNEQVLKAEDTMNRQMELELKSIIDDSLPLHGFLDRKMDAGKFQCLSVECSGEQFPAPKQLIRNLIALDSVVKEHSRSRFSFDDMLSDKNFQNGDATQELEIPVGFTTSGGEYVNMSIGDRAPHFLVGGITGSGKSNFLHNLIVSACWKYSPRELELYLLDFKEGVEFRQYASLLLANARLVATEADTEYGVKVLEHLDYLRASRYAEFKRMECKDIVAYNRIAKEKMPRILIVIDEFQVLFDSNQKDHTMEMFTMLAKQGRACGIHMVLATQSLKGLDFGNVATQFGGRVALKCSADDSKLLLGGITSNNEEASQLSIPYAIMNVSQGSVAGNIKFAVPCAVPDSQSPDRNPVEEKIRRINEANPEFIGQNLRIFEGQRFPEYPEDCFFASDERIVLTLGKTLDYDADLFQITLQKRDENNVLICGRDESMKRNFLKSCVLSARGNTSLEACVYIGDDLNRYFLGNLANEVECYENVIEFMDAYGEEWFGFTKLVILDNCNLAKDISFPPSSYSRDENKTRFLEFWDHCCHNGSFLVALYDGTNSIRNFGLPLDSFCYRVGYALNNDEMNYILSNRAPSKMNCKKKAFFANNQEIENWFRPFTE